MIDTMAAATPAADSAEGASRLSGGGGLNDVPDDVMVHIVDRLSFAELAACASVSRAWRRLCRCDYVWSRRCARRWCLNAMAHFACDSPIRRGYESGCEGTALLEQLHKLGIEGEQELSRAADTVTQLRRLSFSRQRMDSSDASHVSMWWNLFREIETKPLSTSWLQVGDHVDCRWGDEEGSVYQIQRLRGSLQGGRSAAHWEASVLEFGSQDGWVRVHYVGYSESSPWAREWVGKGKLRATGRVNWENKVQVGDQVEVRVQAAETLHDRMYWPATVVGVQGPDGSIATTTDTWLPNVSDTDAVLEPEAEASEMAQASGDAPEDEPAASATGSDASDHSDVSDGEHDGENASADELWTGGSSDEELREHVDVNGTNRLEPLPALLAQAPEPWMCGASQADSRFLVRYPALNGAGAEDAATYGGHEWVGRDQIYPLRVAVDTSGGS
jgi:hypothetical protein